MLRVKVIFFMLIVFFNPFLLGISLYCKWKIGPVVTFSTIFEILGISLTIAHYIETNIKGGK